MIARLAERPGPVGDPPHPAHLPRPHRRHRDPPTRLIAAAITSRNLPRRRLRRGLREAAAPAQNLRPDAAGTIPAGVTLCNRRHDQDAEPDQELRRPAGRRRPQLSAWNRAKCWASSAPTAPASPPPCACSRASSRPPAAPASICGHDIVTDPLAAKAALGYLPEGAPHLRRDDACGGFLDFIADLRAPRRRSIASTRLDYVIGRLQLEPVLAADHRNAVQGLQAPRRPGAGHRARPEGADPRRAHRRPRSAAEARGAHADRRDRAREDHRHLDAHPRRGRRRVHPRHHHRARQAGGRRHARGAARRARPRAASTTCSAPSPPEPIFPRSLP